MSPRNKDARLSIRITEDGMEARAVLYPAVGEGQPLSPEETDMLLEEAGVREGIDREALDDALESQNEAAGEIEFVLARGRSPEDADPPFLKLAQKFFTVRLYGKEVGGRVDFREARPFVIVAAHEALGRYQAAKEGETGITVGGDPVAPGEKQRIAFDPGDNTYRDGDYIRSSIAGRFILTGKRFMVSEVLELEGVDFHTGNIHYPGDVVLRGEIGDGFSLVCGGDLYAAVSLVVTDVQVKGDLSVEGGILGRKNGILKCGGSIRAKFIENLTLECRKDLHADSGILQSRVYVLGKIVCGEKGRIINSTVYGVAGVEAQQLGNPAGLPATVSAGSDFRQLRLLRNIRGCQRRLGRKLDSLSSQLKNSRGSAEAIQELKEEIYRAHEESADLEEAASQALRNIECSPEARILSRDTVYPGVTIEIAQVSLRIASTLPRGEFYLDQEHREIRNLE
jgi:uncharacterized protein